MLWTWLLVLKHRTIVWDTSSWRSWEYYFVIRVKFQRFTLSAVYYNININVVRPVSGIAYWSATSIIIISTTRTWRLSHYRVMCIQLMGSNCTNQFRLDRAVLIIINFILLNQEIVKYSTYIIHTHKEWIRAVEIPKNIYYSSIIIKYWFY